MIGTDYGTLRRLGSQISEALRLLKKEKKVENSIIDRILDDNARALYGLG